MRPKLFLILIVASGVGISPLFAIGAHETVLELTTIGRGIIVISALCAGLFTATWVVRSSRSGSVDGNLVWLRKTRTNEWLARVVLMSAGAGAVAGLMIWMWVTILIRHMSGGLIIEQGTIVRIVRTGGDNLFCQTFYEVHLRPNLLEWICVERGVVFRRVPPELSNVKVGDPIAVIRRHTALGTSASLAPLLPTTATTRAPRPS